MEWEIKWNISDLVDLNANYTWQDAEDQLTDSDVANAPQQQLYLRLDWNISESILLNTQVNHVADRQRESVDLRPDIDNYTTVDFTLRFNTNVTGWKFAASLRNAFDEDVREPSLAPGFIPNDLPMAGKSAYLETCYAW